jgi:hypothetical protein
VDASHSIGGPRHHSSFSLLIVILVVFTLDSALGIEGKKKEV